MPAFSTPLKTNENPGERLYVRDKFSPNLEQESGLKVFYDLFKYSTRINQLKKYLLGIIGIILIAGILAAIFEIWW